MAPESPEPDPAVRLISLPAWGDRPMVARVRQFVCALPLIAASVDDTPIVA